MLISYRKLLGLLLLALCLSFIVPYPSMQPTEKLLAQKSYSLADRYGVPSVNKVFSDNILLTLAYMSGSIKDGQSVSWSTIRSNGENTLTLKPGQTFAFHDQVLPQYQGKVAATTNAHFNSTEGFESDGWLVGDGVCHLASFMNVAAKSAGLSVLTPTPHTFAKINDVSPKSTFINNSDSRFTQLSQKGTILSFL